VIIKAKLIVTFALIALFLSCEKQSSYSIVKNWPIVPEALVMGQVTGVGVNSNDEIVVFHRADRGWMDPMPDTPIKQPTIFIFDSKSGELIDYFGDNEFIMPHGLSIDLENNIWITDVGAHQVKKYSPEGNLLLTLGRYRESSQGIDHFARPTDISFDSNGNIYVSDGYWNTRVIKFSKKGTFISQWGDPGNQPGQFNLPHGISIDQNDHVYVADRTNSRIQIFDDQGKFINKVDGDQIGRPFGVSTLNQLIYIIDGGDQPSNTRSYVYILHRNDRKVIDKFDASFKIDESNLGHDIAVDSNGSIYIADAWANSLRKFELK